MTMILPVGSTSQSVPIEVLDDSGFAVTGLLAATFPTLKYSLEGANADVAFPDLSDLASLTTAYFAGGIKERGDGFYRVDVPDGIFTTAGIATIRGAESTGKRMVAVRIQVGQVPADLQTIKTQAVTCAAPVTVNANLGTTQPVNFTGSAGSALVKGDAVDVGGAAAASATIGTVTNSTNAPTAGDFTAAMKTSLNAATPALSAGGVAAIWAALTSGMTTAGSIGKKLADWVIGTAQTGDSYAIVNSGTTGNAAIKTDTAAIVAKLPANAIADETLVIAATSSILTAVGSPQQAGSAVTLPANPPAGFIAAASIADGAITDAKFTVPTEPTGLAAGVLSRIDQLWRRFIGNKTEQTASELKMFKSDGTTVISTQALSDDGTTQTQGGGS